jgi:hypothetical protein
MVAGGASASARRLFYALNPLAAASSPGDYSDVAVSIPKQTCLSVSVCSTPDGLHSHVLCPRCWNLYKRTELSWQVRAHITAL